jgi:hypothetical protein
MRHGLPEATRYPCYSLSLNNTFAKIDQLARASVGS